MATRAISTKLVPISRSVASRPAYRRFVASREPIQRAQRRCFSASISSRVKKYTTDHEWIELGPDGKTATLGISTYAAKALGDVVFVDLPAVGEVVGHGDAIGAVESVKSASDIMTPVSGKITEVNGMLEDAPPMLNKSPEDDAWIARIEVEDLEQLDGLMDEAAYIKFTEDSE